MSATGYAAARPPAMWLVIMIDLLALLVSFFVMLFSTSQIELEAWRALTSRAQGGVSATVAPIVPPDDRAAPRTLAPRAADLDYLHRLLADKTANHPALREAKLRRAADRIVLALPGDLLFRPDSAELSERARAAAAELAGALRFVANQVEVTGHADPTPPSAHGPFPTNWELSLARALAFAAALRESGYSLDVNAIAYADSRFDEAEGPAAARRVELVIREAKGGARAR